MKILKYFLPTFLLVLLWSFPSHAQLIPVPQYDFSSIQTLPNLPSTVEASLPTVTSFGNQMPTYWFQSQGFDLMGNSFQTVAETVGYQLNGEFDWKYQNFNALNYDKWFNTKLWDSNGNEVSLSNASIGFGENDYLTTQFIFDNSTGEILNYGDTFNTSISSVQAQPTNRFVATFTEILDHFGPGSQKPLAFYDIDNTSLEVVNELYSLPNAVYNINTTYNIGFYCMDISNPDLVYTEYNNQGGLNIFYNSDSPVVWWNYGPHIGGWDGIRPQSGSFVKYGHPYAFRFPNDGAGLFPNVTKNKASTEVWEQPESDYIYYIPAQPYNPTNDVNMTKWQRNPVTKGDTEINNNYDQSTNNTYENSYITNEFVTHNYYPEYNYIENLSEYINSPNLDEEVAPIPDVPATDIPIISNLQKRFPFSIPWDLKNLFSTMAATREAPHFEWEIYFPIVDYTWEINIDLSLWDRQASIFRNCFLILFIISLATFAYRHYFGS